VKAWLGFLMLAICCWVIFTQGCIRVKLDTPYVKAVRRITNYIDKKVSEAEKIVRNCDITVEVRAFSFQLFVYKDIMDIINEEINGVESGNPMIK